MDSEPKKPKNFDDFLKIYSEEKEERKKNIKQLEKKFDDIRKRNYRIPIVIAVAMVFLTALNSWLYYTEVTQESVTQESLISDVVAIEYPSRVGDGELYQLRLRNYGEIEYDLEITITFDSNTTITTMQYKEPEGMQGEASMRVGNHEYFVRFEKIYTGKDIDIRFDIVNELLKSDDSMLIYAKSIEAYTNAGKVIVFFQIG